MVDSEEPALKKASPPPESVPLRRRQKLYHRPLVRLTSSIAPQPTARIITVCFAWGVWVEQHVHQLLLRHRSDQLVSFRPEFRKAEIVKGSCAFRGSCGRCGRGLARGRGDCKRSRRVHVRPHARGNERMLAFGEAIGDEGRDAELRGGGGVPAPRVN